MEIDLYSIFFFIINIKPKNKIRIKIIVLNVLLRGIKKLPNNDMNDIVIAPIKIDEKITL